MLCPIPKLTPLQARLLASISTLLFMGLIYWSLVSPRFAYAAELDFDGSGYPRTGEDHNWDRIKELGEIYDAGADDLLELEEPGHGSSDSQHVVSGKRAVEFTALRGNNIGTPQDLHPGNTTLWQYPNSVLLQNQSGLGVGLPSELNSRRVHLDSHADLRKRDEAGVQDLQARQDSSTKKTIFISATTCQQPTWIGSGVQSVAPPQLTLWVSTTSGNQNLGPSGNSGSQTMYPFTNGIVNASVDASGDWYLAVSAPYISANFTGFWNYQLAVSLDDYFHSANQDPLDPFLFQIDTDTSAALLVTQNLTTLPPDSTVYQQWMNLSAPFIVFAANVNVTERLGMESSFCGLKTIASKYQQIQGKQSDQEGTSSHVQMGMTTRGPNSLPKEQFYVTGLNSSSNYFAYLAMDGNSTASGDTVVSGGGKVWTPIPFTTKTDGNCQLIFNLSFCEDVAYAVPSNPNTQPTVENLMALYDNYAQSWYQNFSYSLAQIPCNTTAAAQYSLVKNCTDCARAYKDWLCAVTIPRCEDFSADGDFLQIRNVGQAFWDNGSMLDAAVLHRPYVPMTDAPTVPGSLAFDQTLLSSFATNQSRNPNIDELVQPGPYKEILPCEDLCFNLVQSCPAALGFSCPYRGRGLEAGYGQRKATGLPCNFPGAVYNLNDARGRDVRMGMALCIAALVGLVSAFG